ncbi:MAG: D-alanyl-D-alanine carboxypeptidase/D-alanyl-D-alanine-endopeptidase [Actinobacteria bacterium]|nr:D-alanyl-D-alanine carboxypeptidase/D-alanyl-D-alanine-endopeptidase [Actinomycetota bacterium]
MPSPVESAAPAPLAPPPSASPDPVPVVRPPSDDDELRARLAGLLGEPRFEQVRQLGVAVYDEHGREVFAHRADDPMLPASTQKLATAAAAMRVLGPEFRYETTVRATAPINRDGVLPGDIVLVGSGDPALATPRYGAEAYPQRPRTPLEALADQLVAAGLRRLTGTVLGDPTVFDAAPLAPGWPDRYIDEREIRYVSGLTVNAGLRLFEKDGRVVSDIVDDPAGEAARELWQLLSDRGVVIERGAAETREPPAASIQLASVESPTLLEMLKHVIQRSDNHMAEGIFLTLGLHAGDATWPGADRAVRAALDELELDLEGAVFADGSGLSRDDRLSAAVLAALDLEMRETEDLWSSLMAVAGESGTLRRRLRGSVAAGRLLGKTGTLDDVRSLAGTVLGNGDERFHFSVVANDLDGAARWPARELTDEIILALVEDLYGCIRHDVPVTTTPAPSPSPYRLECPQ